MPDRSQQMAIVGMAFRFPGGATDEDSFWRLLTTGTDAVGEIPGDRWATDTYRHPDRSEPGRSVTFSAGTLEDLDRFDASFFGISPREASHMDPQQRILLELAWEALENAGQPPSRLAGTSCAVYVGISGTDFGMRGVHDLSGIEAHSMTGSTMSIAANRLSYVFDLRGPSMAVDTACSSSLVALHQACTAIRTGEASAALVGGVNVLLHPMPFLGFTKASMLSSRGRCRAFDEGGDGYVRAEGGAVLLVKPLADAERDGDPIQAVILATGANADGHKRGMTIPSPTAQAELVRSTFRKAGVSPEEIDYLEAHGTGTMVGDPIEAAALGEAVGKARAGDDPLLVGSVKTNVGHLEAAAGMAGLVKTVLCLKRRAIPPSLHLETPNPHIAFEDLNLRVVRDLTPLPEGRAPARMGVNSFGFGGANGHVLLEEHRRSDVDVRSPERLPPLRLTARDPGALRAMAGRFAGFLEGSDDARLYAVAHNAVHRRERLAHGLVAWGETADEVVERLAAFGEAGEAEGVVVEELVEPGAPLALVYSGNGSQWVGMGRRLLDEEPLFRRSVQEVDELLRRHTDLSVLAELEADPGQGHGRLERTEVAQPALFAVQVGITELLRGRGLGVDAAVGHSVGEVAAAWAVGKLSLEQAVRVIFERSAAQAETLGAGRMAAAGISAEEVVKEVERAGLSGEVELAGVNSPDQVTLSGTVEALETVGARLKARGVFFRMLELEYAFHSRHMDGQRERILERLEGLEPSSGGGRFVSTVTGEEMEGKELGASYWWDNVREPVLLDRAVARLAEDGVRIFLEVGPHPILQRYLGASLRRRDLPGRVLPTLRRDDDGPERLHDALWRVHLLGGPVDLERYLPHPAPPLSLPSYPWQRERHWPSLTEEGEDTLYRRRVHPLLGWPVDGAETEWENHLDPRLEPWLADHVVGGAVVFPATGFAEIALAASAQWTGDERHEVEDLEILAPLVLDGARSKSVRVDVDPADGRFRVRARERLSDDPWRLTARGRLKEVPAAVDGWEVEPLDAAELEALAGRPAFVTAEDHYTLAGRIGLEYGPSFRGLEAVWRRGDDALLARLRLPDGLHEGRGAYLLHPALLDVALQTVFDHYRDRAGSGRDVTFLPVRFGKLRLRASGVEPVWCRCEVVRESARSVVAEIVLFDGEGEPVARLEECRFRAVSLGRGRTAEPDVWEWRADLEPRERADDPSPVPAPPAFAEALRKRLAASAAETGRGDHYGQFVPLMDALVGTFAYEAVRGLGDEEGRLAPPDETLEGHPIWSWLLDLLEEDGFLSSAGEAPVLVEPDEAPPPSRAIWMTLLGDHPDHLSDLTLAGRAGLGLARLLEGRLSPEALAESLEEGNGWEHYHAASPSVAAMRAALAETLGTLLPEWPENRAVRVLETGPESLFRLLRPKLPEGRFRYVFTHGDPAVVDRARLDAEGHPGVTFSELDPDTLLPTDEAANGRRYDLVLVRNGLSGVPDPRLAIRSLKRMLARDGLLVLVERRPDRWSALVRGMREDWWLDGARGRPRQLSPGSWQALLQEAGFTGGEVVLEPGGESSASGVFAVLARNPDRPEVAPPARVPASTWLLLKDPSGWSDKLAGELAERLEASGHAVFLGEPGERFERMGESRYAFPDDPQGMESLLDAVQGDAGACDHVVHLMGLQAEAVREDPLRLPALRCVSTLHLVQLLHRRDESPPPRLWLLTRGAATFAGDGGVGPAAPDQAALWGMGRVLMNEHPELRCTLVDLQVEEPAGDLPARLEEELLSPDDEDELILAGEGRRLVSRLRTGSLVPRPRVDAADARLGFTFPGQLQNLEWQPRPDPEPGPEEVVIRTRAVGLNFRDVMYALGLLSDEAVENGFAGAGLGMEVSGRVEKVGVSVNGVSRGDEVVAFAPSGFAGRVVTHAGAVVPKPEEWTFEEATTVPTVFFTAWYALHHLARIRPGEKVLVHGAAGGVGIAALQVARHLGAEVFGTAGNDEKRDFVRLMGADHVLDSRSLAFADEILRITDGEGVDVVLNSLAGEAMRRSVSVLRPFGRFLELGKRDFYEDTRLGLRPFKDNISYFGIDADQLMAERPDLARRIFREVMELFGRGVLRPLPHRTFPATGVAEAFRYMQRAKHIGKIVVRFDDRPLPAPSRSGEPAPPSFDPEGTYLVTGGTSGLGLRTALWLAEHGAGHLLLVSRSGEAAPDARRAREELEARGSRAHIRACDVEDVEALREVLAECGGELPELRGVVHAAMVLEDGLIRNLDEERFLAAMAPKIRGAWHLHALTRELPLDLFVLFSSATTAVGNPGQANYVAANLYLEALAARRRAAGLPATCAAWGAVSDTGYLARNEEVKEGLLSRAGGAGLEAAQVLDSLGRMLAAGTSQLAVSDFDWNVMGRFLPAGESPRFAELRRRAAESSADLMGAADLRALIEGKSEEEVREVVADLVAEEIADILRLPRDRIPLDGSLYDLGMDSLMGVELVLGMEKRLGVSLPPLAVAEEPTVRRIAERLIRLVTDGEGGEEGEDPRERTRMRDVVSHLATTHDLPVDEDQVEEVVGELVQRAGGA